MGDLVPMRGVCYEALPCTKKGVAHGGQCSPGQQLPGPDMCQAGYALQWGPTGRDDLGTMSELNANAVRVYDAFGVESAHDHSAFLDRAQEVGLHVLPGFHSLNLCPDFDCFDAWKAALTTAFGLGFKKDDGWHPSVAIVVLLDQPDTLNFQGSPLPPVCPEGEDAKCRVKAALSAMDGMLAAEKEANVNPGKVNITVAWSAQQLTSIDGKVKSAIGYYGFQDMVAGTANPAIAGYTPRTPAAELLAAFNDRWTHSVNVQSDWTFIHEKIATSYDSLFPNTPWFLSEYSGAPDGQEHDTLVQDMQAIDSVAKAGGSFLGLCFSEFQVAYQIPGKSLGLFGLGDAGVGSGKTGSVCDEDVRVHTPVCREWDLKCLDASLVEDRRAEAVADAWGGKVMGPGLCLSKTTLEEAITV